MLTFGATFGVVIAWPVSHKQIFVVVLDEIAAEDELKFQIAVRKCVRKPRIDRYRCLRRATVNTLNGYVRCGLRRTGDNGGTSTYRQ